MMTQLLTLINRDHVLARIFRFACVGGAAAATHFTVAILLTVYGYLPPLVANVGGFCIAFLVSYWGQSRWTFGGSEPSTSKTEGEPAFDPKPKPKLKTESKTKFKTNAMAKFGLTSLFGLLVNQCVVYVGLYYLGWPFPLSLGVAIVGAAVSTYLISSTWVFKT